MTVIPQLKAANMMFANMFGERTHMHTPYRVCVMFGVRFGSPGSPRNYRTGRMPGFKE